MIHEPTMAMIRTSSLSLDFYDRVMDRIASRPQRPQGVAVHFAGLCDGAIHVVTIYRDTTSRTHVFADFSGPEVANEQLAGTERADVSRDEFGVDRLLLSDALVRTVERPVERELFAYAHIGDGVTPEQYEEAARRTRFPQDWPDGMLLHVSCRHGRENVVIDLWDSQSSAAEFYSNAIEPIAEAVTGREHPDMLASDRAIELHSLTVTLDGDDPLRGFSKLPSDEKR